MELKKIVIHELLKEAQSKEVKVVYSEELTTNDDKSLKLISALNKNYQKEGMFYAIFDDGEGKVFPEKYTKYKKSNRKDNHFISFTKSVMANLEQLIKSKTMATGGYFIFAEYTFNNTDFIGVFLIRDVEGEILKRTKKSFSIEPVEYVDTRNLAMACRINEKRLKSKDKNYLSFTRLKQQTVSDYFKDWISIKQLESSSEYTETLYQIISQLERPIDENTGKEYDLQTFRNKVYDSVKASPNKKVNIRDLSNQFYGNPDTIGDYASKNELVLDAEFRYNDRKLKKFIKLEINKDGINLKFSRGAFKDKIRIDKKNKNLVIIDSEKFADALRKELG